MKSILFLFELSTKAIINPWAFHTTSSHSGGPSVHSGPIHLTAAMGNFTSASADQVTNNQENNMDANFQYSGQDWQPGPPAVLDLTKFIADDPTWWSIHCATPDCPSWLYIIKTSDQRWQRCHICQKPWVHSFLELGPQKTWEPQP